MEYSCHGKCRVILEKSLKICAKFSSNSYILDSMKAVDDSYGLHRRKLLGFTNTATQIAKQDNFVNWYGGADSSVALALKRGLNSVDM